MKIWQGHNLIQLPIQIDIEKADDERRQESNDDVIAGNHVVVVDDDFKLDSKLAKMKRKSFRYIYIFLFKSLFRHDERVTTEKKGGGLYRPQSSGAAQTVSSLSVYSKKKKNGWRERVY